MCFSETQSYINTILLVMGAFYVYPNYRLSITLIFLSLKDLIQGLLYYYHSKNNEKYKNILTSFSWIHICFQPLFVNILMSHFSKENIYYWNFIFIITFLYGLYDLTLLNEFDIQNDPDCIKKNEKNDFCSTHTTSYMGKYHIAYKFSQDEKSFFYSTFYPILIFIPALFTKSRLLGIIWAVFAGSIYVFFNNIGNGEQAAIWCFLSILYCLPVAIFHKRISKLLF
jgi:hypothetical protein